MCLDSAVDEYCRAHRRPQDGPSSCRGHAGHDVTDAAPRVEATVRELKLQLARLEAEEAECGAESRTGGIEGSHSSRAG